MQKLEASDLKKLPKNAQQYIRALELTVNKLNKETAAATGADDSNIFYHVGIGQPRGLPESSVISCRLQGGRVDLYVSEDKKTISVRGVPMDPRQSVSIRPSTANAFDLSF